MRVLMKKNNQLKITLSAVEICDYFGSFDDIRYDNPRARAVLGNLLLEATRDGSFLYDSKRLTIKVIPEEKGGCAIYFTASPKPKRLYKTKTSYIFEFSCCEDMLVACEQLSLQNDAVPCSLFSKGGDYRLLIDERNLNKKIISILSEFAENILIGTLQKEKTQEHWQQICHSTPAKTICGL